MKLMKMFLAACAIACAGAAQAAYMPVGVQTNVSMAQVASWGWTQCYLDQGFSTPTLSSVLGGCSGKYMMLADFENGSSNYAVLAAAERSDVLLNTGDSNSVTHTANGAEWYFSQNYSWGFTELGNTVARYSCDVNLAAWNGGTATIGSCWHTASGLLWSGWAYNDGSGATFTANRVILVADRLDAADVPEPGTLSMIGLGLFATAGALRRSRRKAAQRG